jgi:hypothetical protein
MRCSLARAALALPSAPFVQELRRQLGRELPAEGGIRERVLVALRLLGDVTEGRVCVFADPQRFRPGIDAFRKCGNSRACALLPDT